MSVHKFAFISIAVAVFFFLIGCSSSINYPRTSSLSIDPNETLLGKQVRALEAVHPDQSGFSMLTSGHDAFVARAVFIDAAQRGIDIQQFIFRDDVIGNLILERLFNAADRGVRVRMLLDDWALVGQDKWLVGIAAHPNIEVRTFNPINFSRSWHMLRPAEYVFGPTGIDRRMHNKVLIVDSSVAFVGGRDIADEYFSARDDFSFHDLDLMAVGPVVKQASAAFDEYWNCSLSVPVEAFVSDEHVPEYAKLVREKFQTTSQKNRESQYFKKLKDSRILSEFSAGRLNLLWSDAEFIYDPPAKVTARRNESYRKVADHITAIVDDANSEIDIMTCYFIPGKSWTHRLTQASQRGVTVKLLTNSLASTDLITTYGGLQWYRKELLAAGVQLYETKAASKADPDSQTPSIMAAMHTKCIIADSNVVYVGSMNLDRRSIELDTQDGIIVYGRPFGWQAKEFFDKSSSPPYCYRLILDTKKNRTIWVEKTNGSIIYYYHEPDTDFSRRFGSWMPEFIFPERWL